MPRILTILLAVWLLWLPQGFPVVALGQGTDVAPKVQSRVSASLGVSHTLVVPEEYPRIQEAVDAADPGDTVRVGEGHYEEALVINKPIRLVGEGREQVVLEAPKGTFRLLTVNIAQGEVEISGISIVGALLTGIEVDVGSNAHVVIRKASVAENTIGIHCVGLGRVTVTDSFFASNVGCGIALGNATSILRHNEISESDVGILLDTRSQAIAMNCSQNSVALCRLGVALNTDACGFSSEGDGFTAVATGRDNAVQGHESDVCPPEEAAPWPPNFLVPGFSEAIKDVLAIVDQLHQLRTLGGSREEGERLLSRALTTLDKYPFPLLLQTDLLMEMGYLLLYQKEDMEAVDYLNQARPLFAKCGMLSKLSDVDYAMGRAYLSYGRSHLVDALDSFLRARPVFEREGVPARVAELYEQIGLAYLELQHFAEALEVFEKVLAIGFEQNLSVDTPELRQAIGDACRGLGRYEEALLYYKQVNELIFLRGTTLSAVRERNSLLGQISLRLASIYTRLGMETEARQALILAARYIDDPYADVTYHSMETTRQHISLGDWLLKAEEYEQALYLFESSGMPFAIEWMPLEMAELEVYKGRAYLGLRRYGEALFHFDEARPAYKAHGMWESLANIDRYCGDLYAGLGLYEEGFAFYKRALIHIDQVEVPEGMEYSCPDARWQLLASIGTCYEIQGKKEWANARAAYENAIAVIESMRTWFHEEELKIAWQEETKNVYKHLIDLLYQMGEGAAAFQYTERCRARTFLDLLAMGPVGTIENVAEEGIRSGVVEPSAIEADVDEVVRSLPSNTAALEYFVTDDATYVWVIYQGEIQGPIQLPHGRAELMHMVIDTREQLGSSPKHPFNPRNLIDLYDWLIRPVEGLLPQTSGRKDVPHLIIIPSGPLYYLPFQALIWTSEDRSENAPLIRRYALSYSPSLATLKYAQALADTAYPQATFLALADPDSGDPRLPDAQAEARMVAQLFDVSSVHVDSDATEDMVQSDSATAREILLSTHGLFNPHNPLHSYLVVSPTVRNTDGRLHAYEVFSLPLHADMVVLSACETLLPSLEDMKGQIKAARGAEEQDKPVKLTEDQLKELTAGDEVVGLTRAFISAGASSVLSSLWSVPSGATSKLIVSFYKHIEEGMDKARALRAAQLEVMNTTGYTQPWCWAAFNLMGDWR